MLLGLPILMLAACQGAHLEPLQAGMASARLPAPIGVGTVGYLPFGGPRYPTPYADLYPGTARVHGHPTLEALALSRGAGHQVVVLRSDTFMVHQALREAVVRSARATLGLDLEHALVWGATRTQFGPGRLLDGGPTWELISDAFLPDLHDRVVEAAVGVIARAVDDLAPARLGWATADISPVLMDRRCQDGVDHVDGTTPLLAVEREGRVEAVVAVLPLISAGVGIEELTLSSGMAGATEAWLEESLGAPGQAMVLTSWTADSSPRLEDLPVGDQPYLYDAIEEIGFLAARSVAEALERVAWEEDPALVAETRWVPMSRRDLGYRGEEFPWEWGATLCQSSTPDTCDEVITIDDLDQGCEPFPEDHPAAPQVPFTTGRLGERLLLTFPGAPGTLLAEDLRAQLAGEEVVLVGAAQGDTLYSLHETDWWHGGKEASRTVWGPRQGEWLRDQGVASARAWLASDPPAWPDLASEAPAQPASSPTVEPEAAIDPGTLLASGPPPVLERGDTYVLGVLGSDPWHGTPLAILETPDGEVVTSPGGRPVTSDGLGFWIDLVPMPTYADEPDVPQRAFEWHFSMPISHLRDGLVPPLDGTYRLRIEVPLEDGTSLEVTGPEFEVLP